MEEEGGCGDGSWGGFTGLGWAVGRNGWMDGLQAAGKTA